MAMSFALIVGIIAGAVCLTSLSVVFIVLGLRHRHKRILAQINSGADQGLNGFHNRSSPIMSITDEDVARMPGTRASVHRSLNAPYHRNSLYTPMASRESLPPRAYVPKVRANDRADHQPISPQQSWPLPRRMTRADGTPLVRMPSATLTPATQKSKKTFPKEPRNAASIPSSDAVTSNESLGVDGKDSDTKIAPAVTDLEPKPLFHNQQRSSSHGMMIGLADGSKSEPRASRRMSQFSRSKSMYSQDPGLAPPQPLPPLPFEIASMRLPRVKSTEQITRRGSGGSLFSEQTSILDDNWSKGFPQTGTDVTTNTLASAQASALTSKECGEYGVDHVVWDTPRAEGTPSPFGAAKQMSFRPQLNTQRSFRASVQESLPRSKSSGLSLSMSLHGPSRAESRASLAKDPSSTNTKSKVAIPRSPESRRLRRGISPSSPLCRGTDFTIHDDTNSKRASTSVLHPVSGNEGSSISQLRDERPHSIATSNPLEWDTESLPATKPSTPKDRRSGHQRQSCIRTSSILLVVPSPPLQPAIDEHEELPRQHPQPQNVTRPKQITFRPPSRQDFDFALQTPPSHRRQNSRIKKSNNQNNSPFSPTQFMMNLYREDNNNSAAFEFDTPTRKPSSRPPSSTHPNRRKTIFDHPIPTVWPPAPQTLNPHPDPSKPPTTLSPSRLSVQSFDQDSNPSSRPPSSLINIPWPQPPQTAATPKSRGPKTPIRGPRAPPFRYTSPSNNRRRSPVHSGVGKRSCSPPKDLRRSVAALRRMNSDVGSVSGSGGRKSREHRRYLSIGGSEGGVVFEEEEGMVSGAESAGLLSQAEKIGGGGGEDEGTRGDGKENITGPRDARVVGGMTKLGLSGNHNNNNNSNTHGFEKSPIARSVYDGEGFLKELDSLLR
ncbi:hypothetical protein BDR22DRAFT_971116 [Usnea florida]